MDNNITNNLRYGSKLTYFLLLLSGSRILCRAQEATIAYRPAGGYYVCPDEDMVCTVVSCYLEEGCGGFMNNFEHVPSLQILEERDETVLVSTGPHASLTLGLGDAEEIICDARCTCQPLVKDDDGTCQLAPVTKAPSAAPSLSMAPSYNPSSGPSDAPSLVPSITPSYSPSSGPSDAPSLVPSIAPSLSPTVKPSSRPSLRPSRSPSIAPSNSPTSVPTQTSPIYALLLEVSGSVLIDRNSPQYKAARWLVQDDTYLNFEANTTAVSKLHQRYALVALDFAFHGNSDDLATLTWTDPSVDECDWSGVTCESFDGVPFIRTINWARRNLKGAVLSEFSLFPALESLDLAQNKLEGTLDPFYSLTYLKHLYLFDNQFSGPLADYGISKLNRLERLYLGNNDLTGTLSRGLWQENKDRPLQWLILNNNNLNGSLPLGMRLGHLRYLDLSHNSFSSTIPSDWPDRLLTMRSLYLDHNQIQGSIPTDFAKIGLGWLKQFYANDNQLTGRFPSGWDPIFYLTNIDIRNNQLTRDTPSSVCSMNVFDQAELIELRADCDVCDCRKLCDNCEDDDDRR